MTEKNEPGGGVVPSALSAFRSATRDDAVGAIVYICASLVIAAALIAIVLLT